MKPLGLDLSTLFSGGVVRVVLRREEGGEVTIKPNGEVGGVAWLD